MTPEVSRNESPSAASLRALLGRLKTYKVLRWSGSSNDPDMASDRVEVPLSEAHVVSSLRPDGRHALVLDIDHPAWLVKSTTPGHFHLYIDVPGGISDATYKLLLGSLANAGVIEEGYMRASIERGATMVRLPWIQRDQTPAPAGLDVPTPEWVKP